MPCQFVRGSLALRERGLWETAVCTAQVRGVGQKQISRRGDSTCSMGDPQWCLLRPTVSIWGQGLAGPEGAGEAVAWPARSGGEASTSEVMTRRRVASEVKRATSGLSQQKTVRGRRGLSDPGGGNEWFNGYHTR
mmetsp:Transcript_5814/g.10086  ORF Transcript_5814/g.10086 Transcript_5814/m.10086 type:complete len:135 (+) Transcript_5814:2051-2455(+)